ncbi:DNA helicase [Tanacetum coccineum]
MALNFNLREYEAMEQPVVIAVSSCWVRQFNGIQLSGTSATHYYLNPNIPETYHIKEQCQQATNTIPILRINDQRYEDLEQEKNRNRFPLATLLEVDLENYQVIPGHPIPSCKNHGPQPNPTYSYCFKAIIGDGSGTISLTCFSNQANSLTRDCIKVLTELPDKNPLRLTYFRFESYDISAIESSSSVLNTASVSALEAFKISASDMGASKKQNSESVDTFPHLSVMGPTQKGNPLHREHIYGSTDITSESVGDCMSTPTPAHTDVPNASILNCSTLHETHTFSQDPSSDYLQALPAPF